MFNNRLYYPLIYTILISSISLPALTAETKTVSGAELETETVSGAELYHDYCSVCHGDKGDGNSRAKQGLSTQPRDFTQPGLDQILTRETMVNIVLYGVPGTAMAGWYTRLSKGQAENIVDYVRNTMMSLQSDKDVRTTDTDSEYHTTYMEQPLLNGLSGDYDKGKLFYEANCATCHGETGAGDGPRAYFIFPKPRNFVNEASRMRLNRIVLFNATKYGIRGKEMPAWGKVIDDQEIANIIEYVFKAMIQTENPG